MSNLTVCRVLNKFDESNPEDLVICSIWEDGKLKVNIVKSNSIILFGEVVNETLAKYATTFYQTLDVYLQETKNLLCGINSDIEFFLTDSKFYWKRNKSKLRLGQIEVEPIQNVESLTSFMLIIVDEYSKNKSKLDEIEKDYQNVKLVNSDLMHKLSDFQNVKEQLEDGLYKKFALLLNSKKAKIKGLSDQLKKLKDNKNKFNESTDESESEQEITNDTTTHSSPKSNKKRAHDKNINNKSSNKKQKLEEPNNVKETDKNCSNKVKVNALKEDQPIPSISLDTKILDDGEETPDLLSEESECDFELKFDEEKLEDESAITEQDSEEMF